MAGPEIEVTKLDVAQRQLRSALRLWFLDGDPVSIHTLLSAAHEIIHRLYRNKGLVNLMYDSDLIKDEYRGEFARRMKKAPNFFKHAAQDSRETFIFNSGINDFLPVFLIQGLVDMGEDLALEERSYVYWMQLFEPHVFKSTGMLFPPDVAKNLVGVDKKEFLDACELLWADNLLRNILTPRPSEEKGG